MTSEYGLRYFTLDEAIAIETLVERIFPLTEDGPGAAEAQVTAYIDGQLAGGWGRGERMYRSGPFPVPEHAGHGWQLPLTPAEVYRRSLVALERHVMTRHGRQVADLNDDEVDELLSDLSNDSVSTFAEFVGSMFFNLLLENVNEGLFADPSYGGNKRFAGWKWIGFPGDPDRYGEPYSQRFGQDEIYVADPRGLLASEAAAPEQ
jgi:gluconate 2-dehydrogenase gamma chain